MKTNQSKPLFFVVRRSIALVFAIVLLSGCADTHWPSALTGEPDETITKAPQKVGRAPSAESDEWPSLSDVPDRPTDFTPASEWAKVKSDLIADKAEAEEQKKRLEALEP